MEYLHKALLYRVTPGAGVGVAAGARVGVGLGALIKPPASRKGSCAVTALIGVANPMPSMGEKNMKNITSAFAVLIPITCPSILSKGPPLFPGLIGASV